MANPTFDQVRVPFTNMTFTPDVPATALKANEYNDGQNIETDVRGIRSVLGDEEILFEIPNNEIPIWISGGYRSNNLWWFVFATSAGNWYAMNESGVIDVTPNSTPLTGYSTSTNITGDWNGTTLFVNDNIHPPMYLTATASEFVPYSNNPAGPGYIWNYNASWSTLTAGFLRLFNTPNVGSILISGNLTAVDAVSSIVQNYPTTVRWSQAFGLNDGPTTWAPTTQNIANEVEVPVRGPVVDGFPCNGNFFVCSYWDTVVFSPISYQGTNNPVLGIRPFNQGRGLLNANCWANADNIVYGLDARDIWVFNGQQFQSLGNQRVKNWFYKNLNPAYSDRVFLTNNTSKNQVEIYYPDLNSADGWCNKMISYRYDLDAWNPPRDVYHASAATESPIYQQFPDSSFGFNDASRTVVYTPGIDDSTTHKLIQKDRGYSFVTDAPIVSEFRRDNIHLSPNYSEQLMVHRILPEAVNIDTHGLPTVSTGNITVSLGGSDSTGQTVTFETSVTMALDTANPWTQINQNVYRINSVKIGNSSTTDAWICPAISWQFTKTQDSR